MADFTKLNGYTVKDPYAVHTYDSVADLKADTKLKAGNHVATKGFASVDDGGHASYYITDEELTADDKFIHQLTNGLFAKLIIDDTVNIRTLGATENSDIHDYVLAIIDKGYECYIPSGEWITSPIQIATFNGAFIKGTPKRAVGLNGTTIKPITDQEYIIKVGFDNTTSLSNNIHISNIEFNSDGKTLVNAMLLNRTQFSDFNNIFFYGCKCSDAAMRIRETWECTFDNFYFRTIDAENALTFGTILESGGTSANHFGFFTFENIRGNAVKFENQTGYTACVFDHIDYECGNVPFDDEVRSEIPADTSQYIEYAVIRIDATNADIVINNITVNNIRMFQFTSESGDYARALDSIIIGDRTSNSNVNIEINNISGVGATYVPYLVNGGCFNKIICNGDSFRTFQRLNFSFDGARIFKYIPSKLADNFANANVENTQPHLGAEEGTLYVHSNYQNGKLLTSVKLGNTFHFQAKGSGNVTYAGQNIAVDSEDWTWYSKDITSLPEYVENNVFIGANTNVKVKDYYYSD